MTAATKGWYSSTIDYRGESSRLEAFSIEKCTINTGQLNTNTHTYMYLPYGHVTNGDFPPLLWENMGELSDGCFIQALV